MSLKEFKTRLRYVSAGTAVLLAICLVIFVTDDSSRQLLSSLDEAAADDGSSAAASPAEASSAAQAVAEAEAPKPAEEPSEEVGIEAPQPAGESKPAPAPAPAGPPPPPAEHAVAPLNYDMKVDYGELSPEEQEYVKDPAAFAKEHPEEAKRIHLMRKAERQNALREEYKEKRERILERLSETNRAKNVVVAIMAIIVIVTVILDLLCGFVVAKTSSFARPVVDCLFKELTVLGCIALLVFMSVKTGVPQQLSQQVFGTPSELVEMFDTAHVVIFLVVVLFVCMVALILSKFSSVCAEWEQYELLCIEASRNNKPLSEMLKMPEGHPPLPDDVRNYMVMRHRFLNPPLRYSTHALDASFRFSSYLRECTSEKFRELVEVEPETWGIVMVLIVLSRLYMMISHEETKLAIFLLVGLFLLAAVVAARNKLLQVYMDLVHVHAEQDDDVPDYVRRARDHHTKRPPAKNWFYKLCNGDKEPNPHEQLFWFGCSGPAFLMHLIRTCTFLASIYFAILVYRFRADLLGGAHQTVMVVLSVVCPAVMVYWYLPQVMQLLILTTSIEMMRDKHTVHLVEHDIRRRRRFFVARLLHTLKGYAAKILAANDPDRQPEPRPESGRGKTQMEEVRACFDQCSKYHEFTAPDGERTGFAYIPCFATKPDSPKPVPAVTPEVRNFFGLIGMTLDDEELRDLILELGDGKLGLRFEPTADFLKGLTASVLTDHMIDAIFVDIDKQHEVVERKFDNQITEDEFCAKLVEINSFFQTGSGAEQLIEWLDWAVVTHKIAVASQEEPTRDGSPPTVTRVFTHRTFRALLKQGTHL